MGVSRSTCPQGEVNEMRLCVLVFLCISATYGRGVDILRMDDRNYFSDGEETDGEVACDSCCELPEPDTCGDILNKIDEVDDAIENACSGEEPEVDEDWIEDCRVVAEEAIPECMERMTGVEDEGDVTEEMDNCLQEIIGELVNADEDPAITLQVCKCQGFVANRKKLEDVSELFCTNDRDARNNIVEDDIQLWWLLHEGYYRHKWGTRHFGIRPSNKLPVPRPLPQGAHTPQVHTHNTANAAGRGTFHVGITNRAPGH